MAVNWNFGETILSVLQKERDRKQDQEKLAQTMAFENRQLDLMSVFRNKQLEQDQSQFEAGMGYKEKTLQQDQEQFESKKGLDLLKLEQDQEQFEKSLQEKQRQFDKELGLGYSRLNNDKQTKQDSYGDTPLDFTKINNMIWKDYYKLKDEDEKLTWREKAGEEVTGLLKTTGIGQSVVDEIWNVAGIAEGDTPQTKREKLKNIISQIGGQLNNSQIQALYRMAEVRTR